MNGTNGATGLQGLAGPAGAAGREGLAGPAGLQGDTGPAGLDGDTGPVGSTGLQGDTGPPGLKGDTGPVGSTGLKGDTGPVGLKGDTGPVGSTGLKGDTGSVGSTGPQGPAGPEGSPGVDGTNFATGTGPGFSTTYGYLGCYVANTDGNFGIFPSLAQKVLTTSIDDCASFCAGGATDRTLYLTLGTNRNGQSICTCGNALNAYNYRSTMDFHCNTLCNFDQLLPSTDYCGGQFGDNPLVSVFGAV